MKRFLISLFLTALAGLSLAQSPYTFSRANIDPRINNGLVGWWSGGGSGYTWFDRSGYANNTTQPSAWQMGSPFLSAVPAAGAQKIGPAVGSLDVTGDQLTVAMWVKVASVSTFSYIVHKTNGASTGYAVYTGSGAGWTMFVFAPTIKGFADAGASQWDGRWHHLAATYNNGQFYTYLDGVLKASVSDVGGNIASSAGQTLILDHASAFMVDDVRIYNRALSLPEVAILARSPAVIIPTGDPHK